MPRYLIVAVACALFTGSSIGPAVAQVVPRIPTLPVVPTLPVFPRPLPIVPTPLPVVPTGIPIAAPIAPIRGPVNVHPMPPPPIPLDLTRGGSTLTTTTTPTVDLRGTLGTVGGSTPTINANRNESGGNLATSGRVSQLVSTYADPAMEVREAQDRGVALHLGGEPPPPDKDKDDDQEEGNKWWLWLLLVIGVLVVSSWMRKGK
jgi:hypothetical protein